MAARLRSVLGLREASPSLSPSQILLKAANLWCQQGEVVRALSSFCVLECFPRLLSCQRCSREESAWTDLAAAVHAVHAVHAVLPSSLRSAKALLPCM